MHQSSDMVPDLGVIQDWLTVLTLSILELEARKPLLEHRDDLTVGDSFCIRNEISLTLGLGGDSCLDVSLGNVSDIHNEGEWQPI